MTHVPASALGLARLQHGIITVDQLHAEGVSAYQRRSLVGEAVLVPVHAGVYRVASSPETLEGRCAAACLAAPGLVVSGPTAGRLLGLRRMTGDDIHTIVYRRLVRLDGGVIVHRTNELHPTYDVVARDDGIRILAVPRLVFDLARFLDDDDLESAIEQLLQRKQTNIPRLFAAGRRLRKEGRDGGLRFGRVLARRPMWAKPKESGDELKLLNALGRRGVNLAPQFKLTLPGGDRVHLDGADPTRRFGVEVDHVTWHGGRGDVQYDKWRDRQCGRLGWYISRVTDEDINHRLIETVNELVEIYSARTLTT